MSRFDYFDSFGYIRGATNPTTAGLVGSVPFVAVGAGRRGNAVAMWQPGDTQAQVGKGLAIASPNTWTVAGGCWTFGHAGSWPTAGQIFIYLSGSFWHDAGVVFGASGTLELWIHLFDGYASPTRVGVTSTSVLRAPEAFNFVEMYTQISSLDGSGNVLDDGWVSVHCNGRQVLSYYGLELASCQYYMGNRRNTDGTSTTSYMQLSDPYVSEGDESEPMAGRCYGDVEVWCLQPDASGTYSAWTQYGGSGSDYTCVNDPYPDEDASYLQSSMHATSSTFSMTSLAASSKNIVSLAMYARLKADVLTTSMGIGAIYKQGSYEDRTSWSGSGPQIRADIYQWYHIYDTGTDPATGLPFTTADINASEMGIEQISPDALTHWLRTTSFFAHVFRAGHLPLKRHGGAQVI